MSEEEIQKKAQELAQNSAYGTIVDLRKSDDVLKSINEKLQTIINNQERDYNFRKKEVEDMKNEQDDRIKNVMGMLPKDMDMSEIMKMAKQSLGHMLDDKNSFDASIIRRPARIYEDEKKAGLNQVNVEDELPEVKFNESDTAYVKNKEEEEKKEMKPDPELIEAARKFKEAKEKEKEKETA